MFYIYQITNKITKKSYIGQTRKTVEKRFKQHCNKRYLNTSLLTRSINKYGKDNFEIKVLLQYENVDQNALNTVEELCISYFKTLRPNGYNIRATVGAISIFNTKELQIYILTKPDGIQFCTYGLSHLEEDYNLDVSGLIKVARNHTTKHLGWKCQSLEENYTTIKKEYLHTHGRYELHNIDGKPSFCSYGIQNASEVIGCNYKSLQARTTPNDIMFRKWIDGWSIVDVNQPIIATPKYLPNATHYELTDPDGRMYCRYGLEGVEEETGLLVESLQALTVPSNRRYGKKLYGWSMRKLSVTPEEQKEIDELQERKKKVVEANNAKRAADNGIKNSKKYLLTSINGEPDMCCIGLVHLKESHGLDGSCLLKVMRGKLSQHKGYKCELITV